VVLFFAAWIPKIDINANTDAFLEEESESVATYYETRGDWGTDEFATFCVTADDWFTEAGIARLKEIEADLKAVDFVSHTMSILDVPLLRQAPEEKPNLLSLFRLTKKLGDETTDLQKAADEHATHHLTVGNLISQDGKSLNVLAFLDWSQMAGKGKSEINNRRTKLVEGVRLAAAKWNERLDEPVRLSGIPIIQITMFENMKHDLIVFGIASLLLFTVAFYIVYRRVRFVVLPIVCCLLPPVTMLGAMAYFKVPIGFVTSNMPVLLFVLVLPYTIYFIERYRERRTAHPDEEGITSTLSALGSIIVPCAYSVATTMAGFIALAASKIIPIRDFGQTMTIGIGLGFVVVFIFIAAVSRKLPGLTFQKVAAESNRRPIWIIRSFERVSLSHPVWVLLVSLAVLAVALVGMRKLSAESKFTSYFWPGSEVYQGLEYIDQQMGGTTWIEIILTSKEDGFFRTDAGIDALSVAQSFFDSVAETGNILSLVSLRDEMRKTFKPEWFPKMSDGALLQSINLVAADLVKQTTSKDFRTSRITVRIKETAPSLNRQAILTGLHAYLEENAVAFENLDTQITGVFPVYAEMLDQLIGGQKQSVIFVAVAVYVMLLLLFRSPILALLVLIPQALPVTVVLGAIGFCGIPLDLVTVMIGSIAIGVGIDAAIQYTMRFRAELEATGDHRLALSNAHATIGRAIWIATSIIISGFAILLLSEFFPSVWFGLFTSLAMLISQLATLTILPSLFILTGYPRKRT
jgi:predicted RND superfamily exporter protein